MINPDNFAPFFEVLSHINFAGAALIAFFYDTLHTNLVREFDDATLEAEFANDKMKEVYGLDFDAKNSTKNLLDALRWFFYSVSLLFLKPFIRLTTVKLERLNSKEDYTKKYLPFFIFSGLFCVLMLFLSGIQREYTATSSIIHKCNVYTLYIICVTTLFFFTSTIGTLFFSSTRMWYKTLFFNMCFALFAAYSLFGAINIAWLHTSLQGHAFLLFILIWSLAIFPIFYIFFRTFNLFFLIRLVKLSNPITKFYSDEDMKQIIKMPKQAKKIKK